jgi:DNA (cytosine-5)-methyltransferase 1
MTTHKIAGADLFCGGGGFTEGFKRACHRLGLEYNFVAVNHWDVAIATHSLNHADVRHVLDDLQKVKPAKLFRRASIDILLAAPECTHHSRAAGGVPRNPQSRATAGYVIRWARVLRPRVIIVENVREFREWGPLSKAGKPLKRKKGELFNKWLRMLKRLGYSVDHRVLCAADYGDPTTRERLFVIARHDGRPIEWPSATHSRDGEATMFGQQPKWKSAREHVIDWTDPGQSIFNRKIPLKPNTMRRIWAGMRKFGGAPFLAMMYGTNDARSVERPAPTVTSANHIGLAQPFIMGAGGAEGSGRPHCVEKPMNTVLPHDRSALVQPFLLKINGGEDKYSRTSSIDDPVGAVTAHPSIGLVEPFILPQQSAGRARSTKEPLPTISADGAISLVEPFVVALKHTTEGDNRRVYDTRKPMPTLTAKPDLGVVQPFLVQYNGTADAVSVDNPVPTIPTKDRFGLAEPFLIAYHGSSSPNGERVRSVDEPLSTVDTSNRYALVIPGMDGYALDIRFRMLKVKELARAQGFADAYAFAGTTEQQKKQIGNAVPVGLAEALCLSQMNHAR